DQRGDQDQPPQATDPRRNLTTKTLMENLMELDELKATWQSLERSLQQGNAIQLQLFKDGRFKNMRAGLRPLFWGQIVQILFGVLTILIGVAFWSQHRDITHLFCTGLILHIYGV